jgi:exopolysaccharide production protein ExoZ
MYKSLQACRAFAAILVVLFHLGGTIAKDKYFGFEAFSIAFSFGGDVGVKFFFVLSGFIILNAHRKDLFTPDKLSEYLKKRLLRIYPTYWVTFLLVFFLALALPTLRDTVPHDISILLKSLLLIPQDKSVVGGTGAPVLIVAWTLQYELLFYLCFASLIISRWFSIIIGVSFIYIYVNYARVSDLPFFLSFLSQDYILLFAMGMIVSESCKFKNIFFNKPRICLGIGVVMSIFTSICQILKTNLIIEQQTILYGLASSLIIFGLVKIEDEGKVFGGHRLIQLLGDSSYALYLIHFPLISILCKLFLFFKFTKLDVLGALISYIIIFSICLISSIAFHLWIETPMNKYLKNIFLSSKIRG